MNSKPTESYADSDRWSLRIEILPGRIRGVVIDRLSPSLEEKLVVDSPWSGDNALQQIQNAIYDHPALLDDYRADIVVYTDRMAFMSAEEVESDEDNALDVFCDLFNVDPEDVFQDRVEDYVLFYAPLAGLGPFVTRTFAGARVVNRITTLCEQSTEPDTLSLWPEEGLLYCIARDPERLVLAACHHATAPENMAYHIAVANEYLRQFGTFSPRWNGRPETWQSITKLTEI